MTSWLKREGYLRPLVYAWGLQGANMVILSLSFSFSWRTLWTELINVLGLAMISLCILTAAQRGKWLSIRRQQLLTRGLASCAAGGVLSAILFYPLSKMEEAGGVTSGWAILAEDAVWNACILSMWGGFFAAFYFHVLHMRMEVEKARMLAAVQEAKFTALQSQLNPHFLFNSFNLLRSLVMKEPHLAREAVTNLAEMMRFSLSISDKNTILLAEELAFIDAYLALERLRHEKRLTIHSQIQAGLDNELIPPMLLQTLIENAVKHGINQRIDGVEVTYSLWKDTAGLHVRVTNDGRLLSTAQTTGTGLRNATTRLRLLYGDQAFLRLTQEPRQVVAEAAWPVAKPIDTNESFID